MADAAARPAGPAEGKALPGASERGSARAGIAIGRRETASLLRELTGRGASVSMTVTGSSMHPLVRSGDVVTIAPVAGPVPVGAVVAAEAPGSGGLVVHRVVGRRRGRLLLRGDNGARADGSVPESALIGVVVRVERDGRAVRPWRGAAQRAFAVLVRAGLVRRLLRLRGAVRGVIPGGVLGLVERRRGPARA